MTDLRIKRTKLAIERAFIELTNKQGFSRTTINNIADLAMINRNTFYNHYSDKEDLAEQLSQRFITESEPILIESIESLTTKHIDYFFEHKLLIKALLQSQFHNNQNGFEVSLTESFSKLLSAKFKWHKDSIQANLLSINLVSLIKFLSTSEKKPTINDIVLARQEIFKILFTKPN